MSSSVNHHLFLENYNFGLNISYSSHEQVLPARVTLTYEGRESGSEILAASN